MISYSFRCSTSLPILSLLILFGAFVPAAGQPLPEIEYNNGARSHRFDMLHTALDLRFDLNEREVIGTVRHHMRSLGPALREVELDAAPEIIMEQVLVNGTEVEFQRREDGLTISLPGVFAYGDTFEVQIPYRVKPKKGLYFIQPDSSFPEQRNQIWTQGEGEDHHYWFPLYDYPNDFLTSEVRATVPADWQLLSNGLLKSVTAASGGERTWHYVLEKPHAAYLIMLAAGDYLVTRDTVDGIPLEYWSYPDMPDCVRPTFGRTPDIMRFLEEVTGVPYPWNKYSQVMIAEFMYGGMENTTATTLNDFALIDERGALDYDPDGLVAHELAHQWYGDLVTNRSWGHLWLHESYATYLASRYIEHRDGRDAYDIQMYNDRRSALSSETDPIVNGSGAIGNIYQRGSWVLHMLNNIVGEELFRRANRLFLERHAHAPVETHDLKLAFEDATGLNLAWFFDQWLYNVGTPDLEVAHAYQEDSLRLTVRQRTAVDSTAPLFRLRVPLEFHLADSIIARTVWVTEPDTTFVFGLPERPRFVIFDAGNTNLMRLSFPRPVDELAVQLKEAPRAIDRILAIREMAGPGLHDDQFVLLRDRFPAEPSPFVREEIVKALKGFSTPEVADVATMAAADTAADVRRQAVAISYGVKESGQRMALLQPLFTDPSRTVSLDAVAAAAVVRPEGLEPYLRELKGVQGRRERGLQTWLKTIAVGNYGTFVDDVAEFTASRYRADTRAQALTTLGELDSLSDAARRAVARCLNDDDDKVRVSAAITARAHLDGELRLLLENLTLHLEGERRENVKKILESES